MVHHCSSLHGLRYITEDGRHWTERVLWVLLCACGFFLTVYFIYPIWAKWNEKVRAVLQTRQMGLYSSNKIKLSNQ